MMISTKGRYALRVMLDIAVNSQGSYVSLRDVAQRQQISMKYLESIVASLCRNQLLESLRGKSGGYRFAYPIECYTVGQIIKATEGSMAPVSCLVDSVCTCGRTERCLTLPVWQGLEQVIESYLDSITLQSLLDGNSQIIQR